MIKINNGFDSFLDATGKTLEVAPKLYDDTIQTAAKETGKTLGLVPKTINAILAPLRKWIAYREYSVAEIEKILALKLENIPPEKIVSPEPYVAVPALQAISYSIDNEELRNLYANLLANAMNSDTKNSVHPSFVEIIKQLSPLDAQIFNIIYKNTVNPLINLDRRNKETSGTSNVVKNITLINIAPVEYISISIDNLSRLKLIDIPSDGYYSNEDLYKPFYDLEIYQRYNKMFIDPNPDKLEIDKKVIGKTEIGKLFYTICVKN